MGGAAARRRRAIGGEIAPPPPTLVFLNTARSDRYLISKMLRSEEGQTIGETSWSDAWSAVGRRLLIGPCGGMVRICGRLRAATPTRYDEEK